MSGVVLSNVFNNMNVEVVENDHITIFNIPKDNGVPTHKTFCIGDMAEYDSFNLCYYGTITKITCKTVSIKEPYSDGKVHRLKFREFVLRNYDFDLVKMREHNSDVMNYI